MYYKTKPGSVTAEKLKQFRKHVKLVKNENLNYGKSMGATEIICNSYYLAGGIAGFRFASKNGEYCIKDEKQAITYGKVPRSVRWDAKNSMWVPALKTKLGRELKKEINALKEVPRFKVRTVLGSDFINTEIARFKIIGESCPIKEMIGGYLISPCIGSLGEMPEDCTEIKTSEYYYLIGE